METLKDLIERKPDLVKDWSPNVLKERLDKPYSYVRNVFPRWYLSKSEYNALFRGYPQKQADAFFYNQIGHTLVALFDCRSELYKLLKSEEDKDKSNVEFKYSDNHNYLIYTYQDKEYVVLASDVEAMARLCGLHWRIWNEVLFLAQMKHNPD